jgi:hypothetical protein
MDTRNVLRGTVLGVQMAAVFCTAALASDDADYQWQKHMLFSPSNQQLQLEALGRVFIYAGIKSADIDLAMDRYGDRIENMMFVNTVWTDADGELVIDSSTGEPVTDDDC